MAREEIAALTRTRAIDLLAILDVDPAPPFSASLPPRKRKAKARGNPCIETASSSRAQRGLAARADTHLFVRGLVLGKDVRYPRSAGIRSSSDGVA